MFGRPKKFKWDECGQFFPYSMCRHCEHIDVGQHNLMCTVCGGNFSGDGKVLPLARVTKGFLAMKPVGFMQRDGTAVPISEMQRIFRRINGWDK